MCAETLFQETVMGSAKEEVRRILEQIPDNASFEDIQYHIYVRGKIERGLEDVKQGRVIEQEEVERRMRKWTAE
jgi:predicted transcriptional regulator